MSGKIMGCVVALCLSLAAPALAEDAAAQCTRLAANPYDPATPTGGGVALKDIDSVAAIAACEAAVKAAPTEMLLVFQLGRAYDAAEDFAPAIANYQTAIAGGQTSAMVALGLLYELGLGVDADASRATELYQKAFDEAGLALAAANLGYAHETGVGVEPDMAKAVDYYTIASDGGVAWASTRLGFIYDKGNGVKRDVAKAVALYQVAAAGGDADGINNLGYAYENGLGGLEQSDTLALTHYQRAAEGGSGMALSNLGDIYAYGKLGQAADLGKATSYYRAAIETDATDAVASAQNGLAWQFALAKLNLDEAEALATASLGFDPESPEVLDTLGWIKHLQGEDAVALTHLKKAAKLKPATTQLAHLGAVQVALGDVAAARRSYDAALANMPKGYAEPSVDTDAIARWLAEN